jgi:hypothetical protein
MYPWTVQQPSSIDRQERKAKIEEETNSVYFAYKTPSHVDIVAVSPRLQHRPAWDEDRLPIVKLDPNKNKRHPLTPAIRSRSVDLTIQSRSWVDGRRASWMLSDETVTTICAQGGRRLRRVLKGVAMVVGRRFRLAGPRGGRGCCVVLRPRPGRRGRCRRC